MTEAELNALLPMAQESAWSGSRVGSIIGQKYVCNQ